MREVSLLQDDHDVPYMSAPEMYPHRRPRPGPSRATLHWALPSPPLGELYPIGCRLPPSSSSRSYISSTTPFCLGFPMLYHSVCVQVPCRHPLSAAPALDLLSFPLYIRRPLSRHFASLRHPRLISCRWARSAGHADRLTQICLQPHAIKQSD